MVEPTNTTVTVTVDADVYRRVEAAQAADEAARDQWLETNTAKVGRARLAEVTRVAAQARRELATAYDALVRELADVMPLSLPLIHQVRQLERRADEDDKLAESLERPEVDS